MWSKMHRAANSILGVLARTFSTLSMKMRWFGAASSGSYGARPITVSGNEVHVSADPSSDGRIAWLLVHHRYDRKLAGGVDDKFIGFFSKRERALSAIDRVSDLPGFKDSVADFEIVELVVDRPLNSPGIRLQY